MARALAWQHRQGDGSWKPVGVFLGTRHRLDGKVLPGDGDRAKWFASIIDDAQRPQLVPYAPTRGTWEDWIGWALSAHSNGHDAMMVEVEPELTVQQLYEREVLGIKPKPLSHPNLRPSDEVPSGLTGTKSSDRPPNQPPARA